MSELKKIINKMIGLEKILYEVYREGFESALARSDKHAFDVIEEGIKQTKQWVLEFLEGTPHKFTAQSIIDIRRQIKESK